MSANDPKRTWVGCTGTLHLNPKKDQNTGRCSKLTLCRQPFDLGQYASNSRSTRCRTKSSNSNGPATSRDGPREVGHAMTHSEAAMKMRWNALSISLLLVSATASFVNAQQVT